MTKNFKKITLSVATSAILVGNVFALDPAVTNFGYVGGNDIPLSITSSGVWTIDFATGKATHSTSGSHYVRCVRGSE